MPPKCFMFVSGKDKFPTEIPKHGEQLKHKTVWTLKTKTESRSNPGHKLTDGKLSTYWGSSGRCPHGIDITFNEPTHGVSCVAMYIKHDDGSYCPSQFSIQCQLAAGGKTPEEKYEAPSDIKRGWVILPTKTSEAITGIHFAVIKNRSGGCDCKARAVLVFGNTTVSDTSQTLRLQHDCLTTLPTLMVDPQHCGGNVQLLPEGSDTLVPAHRFVLATHSSKFAGMLRDGTLEREDYLLQLCTPISPVHLGMVTHLLYTGRVGVLVHYWDHTRRESAGQMGMGSVTNAMMLASELDIPLLAGVASDYFLIHLQENVTFSQWLFGVRYGDEPLVDMLRQSDVKNLQEGLASLDPAEMVKIMERVDL
eukprot:gnl/Dysnectes_brevis/547_a604_5494.p1 GENE.gnl/Dysnectes_brevis/547_a604_5494~~gnl/Dysnectes_brevis/547_a604_5494.p1  ORF type:complete len:364 (+),score=105.94 gnl/Dysnectes_brevis/547_a604_5494:52-1143(+)